MGVYIPNMKMPEGCIDCPVFEWYVTDDGFDEAKCLEGVVYTNTVTRPQSCPLIEIDESEMEFLYKEFGLEKDENLTERAKELKRAILMGYLYAKREIVRCKECKYTKIYALQSDAPMKRWCHKGHFPKEVTDGYYCGDGERRNDDIY